MVERGGGDYELYVDHTTRTITVIATYYTLKGDADAKASAEQAAGFWNGQSGKFEYAYAENAPGYTINFNVQIMESDDSHGQAVMDEFDQVDPVTGLVVSAAKPSTNAYIVLESESYVRMLRDQYPVLGNNWDAPGITLDHGNLTLIQKKSNSTTFSVNPRGGWSGSPHQDVLVGGHEMGRGFGLSHIFNHRGMMNQFRYSEITDGVYYSRPQLYDWQVDEIIRRGLDPMRFLFADPDFQETKTSVRQYGEAPPGFDAGSEHLGTVREKK